MTTTAPLLIADPAVAAVPLVECGDPMVDLTACGIRVRPGGGPLAGTVRAGLAHRLRQAQDALPGGHRLLVVEGRRPAAEQRRIHTAYVAQLASAHPALDEASLHRLASRYVAPLALAPHVAGAAVDLTLADSAGTELWLGSALDATPEESDGACFTDADVDGEARHHRELLAAALGGAGLVNYPTEWWHWSFGDRYWALVSGYPCAIYGPVER